jgi:hypothetical protein
MASFWDSFEEPRIDIEACLETVDDVLVKVCYVGRGKTSGIEVDLRGWHVWTLRGGKAGTKREALAAAGLSE